jgi:hypothetical protein
MTGSRRPRTAYDPDLADAVLDALRDGLTIVQACRETGRPGAWDVMRWTRELPEFGAALGMALRDGALIRAERATLRAQGEDAPEEHKPKTAREAIARDRLAFTANRFLIGLYDPASLKRPQRFPTSFQKPGRLVRDTYTSAAAPRPAGCEARRAPSGFPGGLARTLSEVDRLEALVDAAVQDREVEDLGAEKVDELTALPEASPELAGRFAAQLDADPRIRRLMAEDGARAALEADSAKACEAAVAGEEEPSLAVGQLARPGRQGGDEAPDVAPRPVAATQPAAETTAAEAPGDGAAPAGPEPMPAWKVENLPERADRSPRAMIERDWNAVPWAKRPERLDQPRWCDGARPEDPP